MLSAYARNAGKIVHERPRAVLLPGNADDIVSIIQFAQKSGIRIAARGHGHQPFGEAQVRDGARSICDPCRRFTA
jgi:FAD/FMN-containing dehydrogenase